MTSAESIGILPAIRASDIDRQQKGQAGMDNFDSPPESVDGHLHFSASWDGRRHHVFVSAVLISHEAGRTMSRAEMADYLVLHAKRYIAVAKLQFHAGNVRGRSITLEACPNFGAAA